MIWDPEGGESISGRTSKRHINWAWRTAEVTSVERWGEGRGEAILDGANRRHQSLGAARSNTRITAGERVESKCRAGCKSRKAGSRAQKPLNVRPTNLDFLREAVDTTDTFWHLTDTAWVYILWVIIFALAVLLKIKGIFYFLSCFWEKKSNKIFLWVNQNHTWNRMYYTRKLLLKETVFPFIKKKF